MDGPKSREWKVAAAVHPNFRLTWVDSENERETIISWVKDEVRKMAGIPMEDESDSEDEEASAANRGTDESERSDDSDYSGATKRRRLDEEEHSLLFRSFKQNKRKRSRSASVISTQELEIDQFLNANPKWNKMDRTTLVCLHDLYLKTNTPLPSSAPVERLFSLAGRLFVPLRANLGDEHFQMLIFLRANQHLYNINTGKPTPLALEGIGSEPAQQRE
jgi:hypothetical protein